MIRAIAGCLCLLLVGTTLADAPGTSYIFPAGARRGTSVQINVGGFYLHQECNFEMLGGGVKAPKRLVRAKKTVWFEGPLIPMPASQAQEGYPKDQTGLLKVSSQAKLGYRRWRVSTAQGVTQTKMFVVGNLPEVIEQEIDGRPIPTPVNLPVTINGRIFPREDVDIWTFQGRKGQSYVCEVMANRIGSPLDSRIEVRNSKGIRLAENVDALGSDSRLKFVAPADDTYSVHIHDVSFKGLQDYVYRLTITDGPYVETVYPLGGRRGSTTKFAVLGENVSAGPIQVNLSGQGKSMLMHSLMVGGKPSNNFGIELGDLPEFLEVEPNQKPTGQAAQTMALPAVLNGRIDKAGDEDVWLVKGRKGERFRFDVRANRLGSPLNPTLKLESLAGKQLAANDDMTATQSDSQLTYSFKENQTVVVRLASGLASEGGKAFAYRLVVERLSQQPRIRLPLPVTAQAVQIGGKASLNVTVERMNYNDEIPLKIVGLPSSVKVTGNKIPKGKTKTKLTFIADKKAGVTFAKVKIFGVMKVNGKEQLVQAYHPAATGADSDVDHLLLGVVVPTPWKVVGIFQTRYAARGSTYFRKFSLQRNGFKGPLTIKLSDKQARHLQGVTAETIVVPPAESEFVYAIKLAPWMEVGRTSRTTVMAIGKVKDGKGKEHVVSFTSHGQNDQIIVLVDPGQLTINCQRRSYLAKPNSTLSVKVRVGRGGRLLGLPCKVELVTANHIQGVKSRPVMLSAKQQEGIVQVRFGKNVGPFNLPVIVRVTAMIDGYPYTAEEKVDFRTEE